MFNFVFLCHHPYLYYTPQSLRECIVFGRFVCLSICLSVRIFLSSLAFELLHKQTLYFLRSCRKRAEISPGIVCGLCRGATYRVLGDCLAACRSRATILLRTYVPIRVPYTQRSIRALNQGQQVISSLLYRRRGMFPDYTSSARVRCD